MTKNPDITERFLQAYEWLQKHDRVIDKKSFAKKIGVSPSFLTEIAKGRSSVGISAIQNTVKEYGVSSDWILMGIGTIDGKAPLQQELVTEEYYNQSKQGLPYYDVDFLGGFNDVFSDHTITPSYYIDFKPYNHADFWCNLSGDSMSPRLNNGDFIALKQCSLDSLQYGEIYAVDMGDIRTVKVLRKGASPKTLRFIPINTDEYDEQEYPISRILHLFKVIGSIRSTS